MGYLKTADTLVKNSQNALDKILQSGAAISITGMGEPILVTWINVNHEKSNVLNGLETVDELLGENSPLRYNRVENQPAYGIARDIQNLEMALDDNGVLDMNWEIEPVLPPHTVIPSPYDYMIYKFDSGRVAVFRVNDVKTSTAIAMTNGFYKVPMHLVDMDSDDYETKIDNQVEEELEVNLDRVGSNKRCIINSKTFDEIKYIDKVIRQTVLDYVDTFFNHRYNSFIFRGYGDTGLIVYDPHLTKFIIKHNILEYYNDILQPVVIDQDETFKAEYNKTVFRAVEMRESRRIKSLLYDLTTFTRQWTNPFTYWGEESVYLLRAYEDKETHYSRNTYMDFNWLYNIKTVTESPTVTMIENIIIRYFQKPTFEKFMTLDEVKELQRVIEEPGYSETFFYLIPIILYILISYNEYLNESYS